MSRSGYVPLEEYRQIKASWRGVPLSKPRFRFDYGSARENLDRCFNNLRQLAREESELRDLDERLPPGDDRRLAQKVGKEEIPSLRERITRNQSEQKHWREYVDHYQPLAAAEAPPVAPRLPTDPLPAPDPRLPREPGMDDEEPPREIVAP